MITNKLLFLVLCTFYFLKVKAELKEEFEVKADEIMNVMLDGIYNGYLKKFRILGRNVTNYIRNSKVTKSILYATKKIMQRQVVRDNITLEEFNTRRRERTLKKLLEYKINPSPNFKASEDDIEIETRRFNKLNSSPFSGSARREFYFDTENGTYIYGEKNKTIALMQQFIYETHYMFPYMQIVRRKYIKDVKYQMGYCFALLRNLKKQQMMIYSTLKNYFDLIMTLYGHLQLYQKILRLDVDIKDVLRLMYALDAKRKEIEKKKSRTTTTTPSYTYP